MTHDGLLHIPVKLHFRYAEAIFVDLTFEQEPTKSQVQRAAHNVAIARGAWRVVIPTEWR
jgi:hypothetical protein